jgi:hypothetical protein
MHALIFFEKNMKLSLLKIFKMPHKIEPDQPIFQECPICATAHTHIFREMDGNKLYIYKKCRHIFFPTPSEEYLSSWYSMHYSTAYEQLEKQTNNTEYYREHIRSLSMWSGLPLNKLRIIDYGCSYPVLLCEAKELGVEEVLGIDYSKEAKDYLDYYYSAINTTNLDSIKGLGIDPLLNVPFFLGEDSVVFARKQK